MPVSQAATPVLPGRMSRFLGVSARLALTLFLVRLVVDTSTRIVYPFIPQFAAGLQVSVVGFGWLISLRSAVGLAGPLLGLAADRYGKKTLIVLGLAALSLGYFGMFLLSGWWIIVPMVLMGLGTAAFVPAQQAFISDQAAADRRGRALAAVDMSFAITGVVILPLIGSLIEASGWRAPFAILGGLCAVATLVTWRRLPHIAPSAHAHQSFRGLKGVLARPNVIATVLVAMLLFFAYSSYLTIWSVWLNARFGLNAAETGVVATAVGLAELTGVIVAALFIDRIGKRRGAMIGLVGAAALLGVWFLAQGALLTGIAAIVVLGGVFEYTIIALFPLVSEQHPEARATVFSLMGLGVAIGLTLGSPIAAVVWQWNGLAALCAVAAAALVGAMALVRTQLVEAAGADT